MWGVGVCTFGKNVDCWYVSYLESKRGHLLKNRPRGMGERSPADKPGRSRGWPTKGGDYSSLRALVLCGFVEVHGPLGVDLPSLFMLREAHSSGSSVLGPKKLQVWDHTKLREPPEPACSSRQGSLEGSSPCRNSPTLCLLLMEHTPTPAAPLADISAPCPSQGSLDLGLLPPALSRGGCTRPLGISLCLLGLIPGFPMADTEA